MANLPRNVRNNNPGNMTDNPNDPWKGTIGYDGRFPKFKAPEWGFRAMYIDLLGDMEEGKDTIQLLIEEYAPRPLNPGDDHNETDKYIDYLANKLRLSPAAILPIDELPAMMLHMSNFEGAKGAFNINQAVQGAALAMEESFIQARLNRMSGGEYV